MTLVLDLPPQQEQELQEAIAISDTDQMRQLLTSALDDLISSLLQNPSVPLTDAEWDREAEELADLVDANIDPTSPILADYVLSRETIYDTHP